MVSLKQQQNHDMKLSGLFMLVSYYEMVLKMMASVKFIMPYSSHPIVYVHAQSLENQTLQSLLNKKINSSIGKWIQGNKNCDCRVITKNIEEAIKKTNEKISAIVKKRT